jgi:hypothetical protein
MSCIIKGQSIRCTEASHNHVMRGPENQKITVLDVKGFATKNADEALTMMELSAIGTKCQKPVYSAKINPETDRLWTKQEVQQAVELLEKNLNLVGHQRVVIEHVKKGRTHYHVLWNRFHPDGGRAKNMGNDYAIHQKTQKELEQAFKLRPLMAKGRDFKDWEVKWAARYGFDIFKLRKQITNDFHKAKSGQEFMRRLKSRGIVLCRGDKSQFILILPWGQHKSLSRMLDARPTKAVLRRAFGDIDLKSLPTVEEGKSKVKTSLARMKEAEKFVNGFFGTHTYRHRRGSRTGSAPRSKAGTNHKTTGRQGAASPFIRNPSSASSFSRGHTPTAAASSSSRTPTSSWRPYGIITTSRFYGSSLHPLAGFTSSGIAQPNTSSVKSYPLSTVTTSTVPQSGTGSNYHNPPPFAPLLNIGRIDGATQSNGSKETPANQPMPLAVKTGDPAKNSQQAITDNSGNKAATDNGGASSGDDYLSGILAAISDEVQSRAAGASSEVMQRYASAIDSARRTMPPHQLAGYIAALMTKRNAELAAISRNAAIETAARRKAAIELRRRPPQGGNNMSPRPR